MNNKPFEHSFVLTIEPSNVENASTTIRHVWMVDQDFSLNLSSQEPTCKEKYCGELQVV